MRFGVGALMVMGLVATGSFIGCSDDEGAPPQQQPDAVAETTPETDIPDTVVTPETSTGDADAAETTAPVAPRVLFVHAAQGVPVPVRLCVAANGPTTFALPDQLPATDQGIPFGAGGALPVPANLAPQLPNVDIYVYAVPFSVDKTKKCNAIITAGADGGPPTLGDGAVSFGKIEKGAFKLGGTQLVVALGCPAGQGNNAAGKAKCGPAYDDTANLRATVTDLDRATNAPADGIAAQFVHLSAPAAAAPPAANGVFASLRMPGAAGDAGTDADDAGDAAAMVEIDIGNGKFPADNTAAPVPGPLTAVAAPGFPGNKLTSAIVLSTATEAGAKGAPLSAIELAKVEASLRGATTITAGRSYVFIAVGNFPVPLSETEPTGFRVIALPIQPEPAGTTDAGADGG
jgi:hypothetical protein